MTATDELRRMLDERGIEHDDYDPDPRYSRPTSDRKTEWDGASFREWPNGTIRFGAKGTTPAQAIAATVDAGTCGDGKTTVAVRPEQEEWDEQLEVNDGVQQWYSPLVHPPKAIELHFADGVARFVPDVATVGRRDTMELWPEWEQVLFANVTDEVAQDNLNECVHELLEKAATLGRSCESCTEMDNPDSYIVHLHRALEVADSGVGTCQNIAELNREGVAGYFFVCSECGLAVHASFDIRETNYPRSKPDGSTDLRTFNSNGNYEFERCPRCGRKVAE